MYKPMNQLNGHWKHALHDTLLLSARDVGVDVAESNAVMCGLRRMGSFS